MYLAGSPIYSIIDSRVGASASDAHFFLLPLEIGGRGLGERKARRRALFLPKRANLFDLGSDLGWGCHVGIPPRTIGVPSYWTIRLYDFSRTHPISIQWI